MHSWQRQQQQQQGFFTNSLQTEFIFHMFHISYLYVLFVDISLKHQLFSNSISSQCRLPVSCHRRRGVARYPSPSTRQGSRSLFRWSLTTCTQFPGQMWPCGFCHYGRLHPGNWTWNQKMMMVLLKKKTPFFHLFFKGSMLVFRV